MMARQLNFNAHHNITFNKNDTIYELHSIDQVEKQMIQLKTEQHYIHLFVNFIKDNILKKYPDMTKITIIIKGFDKENRIHQFALSITTVLNDLYKYNICLNKSIFVCIMDKSVLPKLMFIGNISF